MERNIVVDQNNITINSIPRKWHKYFIVVHRIRHRSYRNKHLSGAEELIYK